MGDRAQLIIEREDTKIYFYTHWRGSELPRLLAAGLERGQARWGDSAYLPRILFCEMIPIDEHHATTGFGISTQYQDSCPETDLIVDMDEKRVRYLDHSWTFEEYVNTTRPGRLYRA